MLLVDDSIFLLLRAMLAMVLIAAGAAKLADARGFAVTLVSLGLPARRQGLVTTAAYAVPLLELATGFITLTRLWPAATSLAILAITGLFTALTGWAVVRRTPVTCRCFGALTDSKFSRRGLVRNAALTIMATVVFSYEVAWAPEFPTPRWAVILVLLGYATFAVAAALAARTLSVFKESEEGYAE